MTAEPPADVADGESDEPPQRTPGEAQGEFELIDSTSGDFAPRLDLKWIESNLHKAAGLLPAPIRRLAVRIVDDAAMRDLNRRYHNVDDTTDVLTFAGETDEPGIDADIAVCADVARRRAAESNHRIERELLLYIIHGLLHCCGFDDADPDQAAHIHAEEDRILRAIGVGETFAASPRKPEAAP